MHQTHEIVVVLRIVVGFDLEHTVEIARHFKRIVVLLLHEPRAGSDYADDQRHRDPLQKRMCGLRYRNKQQCRYE